MNTPSPTFIISNLIHPANLPNSFAYARSRSRLWIEDKDTKLLLIYRMNEVKRLGIMERLSDKFTPSCLCSEYFLEEFKLHQNVIKPLSLIQLDEHNDCVLYGDLGIRQGCRLGFKVHAFSIRRHALCIITDKDKEFPESINNYVTVSHIGKHRAFRILSIQAMLL